MKGCSPKEISCPSITKMGSGWECSQPPELLTIVHSLATLLTSVDSLSVYKAYVLNRVILLLDGQIGSWEEEY